MHLDYEMKIQQERGRKTQTSPKILGG